MMKRLALLFLLFTIPTLAGPKQFLRGYKHHFVSQFQDMRRHPFSWGLEFAGIVALNFADAGTTCYGFANDSPRTRFVEGNPFLGHRPSCQHAVAYMSLITFGIQGPSYHYISEKWTEKCQQDALDINGRWNHMDAATHNPESCRWNVPVAALGVEAGIELPAIKNNTDALALLRKRK